MHIQQEEMQQVRTEKLSVYDFLGHPKLGNINRDYVHKLEKTFFTPLIKAYSETTILPQIYQKKKV